MTPPSRRSQNKSAPGKPPPDKPTKTHPPLTQPSVYQPRDELYLWWLADPSRPVHVGELNLVRSVRGVSLRCSDDWIERGFALSGDLPLLSGQEFLPRDKDTASGAVDDARPDRWGERVIRFLDKPARLSLLEYLYFAGDDRFGALGVSTSESEYAPRRLGPLPTLADADSIAELVTKVLANEPIAPELKRLIFWGSCSVRASRVCRGRTAVEPCSHAVGGISASRGGRV